MVAREKGFLVERDSHIIEFMQRTAVAFTSRAASPGERGMLIP